MNSAKSRYILAEKLWTDGKHAAAVSEFDRVAALDPRGKLGAQARYRAALTQTLYLSQHAEAVRKFRQLLELNPGFEDAWEVQKQIGEILYARTEQYEAAIHQYRELLSLRPDAIEAPEFLFRIAKSHFFLHQFTEAADAYQELQKKYPQAPLAEQAAYEVGVTWYTQGEDASHDGTVGTYKRAQQAFEDFIRRYPQSTRVVEAKFGIGNCLEELEQLDAAYQIYESLQKTYPSPNVIKIKMIRIRERQAQKGQ